MDRSGVVFIELAFDMMCLSENTVREIGSSNEMKNSIYLEYLAFFPPPPVLVHSRPPHRRLSRIIF